MGDQLEAYTMYDFCNRRYFAYLFETPRVEQEMMEVTSAIKNR